jgi:hypothetical protein
MKNVPENSEITTIEGTARRSTAPAAAGVDHVRRRPVRLLHAGFIVSAYGLLQQN